MCEQPDPFLFPALPDEAAAAINQFLEDFYHSFQNRYAIQLYRHYRAIEERAARHHLTPPEPQPLEDPPF